MKPAVAVVVFLLAALNVKAADSVPRKMVSIPAGDFVPLYGSQKGEKQKEHVDAFQIDAYPVTIRDFLVFIKKKPKWKKSKLKKIFRDKDYLISWKNDTTPSPTISKKSPITEISWFAAKAYCEFEQKRLPTIMEWEYVASDGLQKNNEHAKKILDWYAQPNPDSIGQIGSTFENKYGVWDLHGLIWEWTLDFNSSMVTGESRGDSALEKSLYCGSGSQGAANAEDYAAFMRFAFRSSLKANYSTKNLGFRCAKSSN